MKSSVYNSFLDCSVPNILNIHALNWQGSDINGTYKVEDIDKIEFFVDDDLSGISNIDNISLKIDEVPLLFEYNTYRKKIFYNFDDWLTIGEHSLNIEIKDNVGNTTIIKGNFLIK